MKYEACVPDPFEGLWPVVCVPEVPGLSPAYCVEVQPALQSAVRGGDLSWPRAWGEATARAALAQFAVVQFHVMHLRGLIDYGQVLEAAELACLPWRAPMASGSFELVPAVGDLPATQRPIYAELRRSELPPPAMPPGSTPEGKRVAAAWAAVRMVDRAEACGWRDDSSSLHYITRMARSRYAGRGLAPEVAEDLLEVLSREPRGGRCELPR